MCGLIGIVVGYDPKASSDLAPLARALSALERFDAGHAQAASQLDAAVQIAEPLAAELIVWPGFRALNGDDAARARALELARRTAECAEAIDRRLAEGRDATSVAEKLAAAAVRARDLAWK